MRATNITKVKDNAEAEKYHPCAEVLVIELLQKRRKPKARRDD